MRTVPDRVIVYGVTGSGKSTLARRLGEHTGLPWHSIDDVVGWNPGWVGVPAAEQRARVEKLCAGDRWIFDSMYSSWRDVALARAELIVALDYPRWLSLSRLLRRTLVRSITRRRICNGNVESVRLLFSADSIIRWHFQSFTRKRERIRGWAADPSVPILVLTTPRATRRWLAEVTSETA